MNTRSSLKSKTRRRRKILLITLIPFFALIISVITYGGYLFLKAADVAADSKEALDRGELSDKRDTIVDPKQDSVSMLIMGIDDSNARNYGDATRTDTLILSTFNVKEKTVKMISIPRDSYVYIPSERKRDKITHAHVFGGTEGTIETVEQLFDIPVDYFVKLNFHAFVDVIDALGGIQATVPYAFDELNSKENKVIHLEPGLQRLDGEEALALARTRKLDNDIERGKRQLEIIKSIMNKAVSAKSISKYGDVIETIGDNMTTNLTFNEMLSFINYVTASDSINMETYSLNGYDLYLPNRSGNEIYYYELDEENLATVQSTLKSHLDLANPIVLEESNSKSYDKS